jgi:hypothetical protein
VEVEVVVGSIRPDAPIKTHPETQAQPMAGTARAKVETVPEAAEVAVANLVVQED